VNPLIWFGAGLILALIVLLLVYRRESAERTKSPVRDHHLAALEALADREDDLALGELQAAVQLGQGGVDAYLRLADIYRAQGKLQKAIHIHRSLGVSEGNSPDLRHRILRGLAEDYLAAGRWDDALQQLEELRKIDARDPAIQRRLSQVHLRRKDADRAQQALKRAHKLEGESRPDELAILHAELARHHMAEQAWREARKAIQESLKQDADCLAALKLSADLYLNEGKEQDAADEMQRATLTGQPGSEQDYPRMEKQFFEIGRYHEIQFVYQELLSLHPDFWPARFALAVILEKRGRRDEGVALLDPAMTADDTVAGRAAAQLLDWGEEKLARTWLERWSGEAAPTIDAYRCRSCGAEHGKPRWYCPACSAFKSYDPIQGKSRVHSAS
jgi:lipopolysaccharide biosynthesis regulator YciM